MASFISLLDLVYPVGAYYMSNSSGSPASKFGGSWTQLTDSRVPIGASSVYTGGSSTHTHTYGVHVCTQWCGLTTVTDSDSGIISLNNYSDASSYSYNDSSKIGSTSTTRYGNGNQALYRKNTGYNAEMQGVTANVSYSSTYPPYRSCYMYYRTA